MEARAGEDTAIHVVAYKRRWKDLYLWPEEEQCCITCGIRHDFGAMKFLEDLHISQRGA
jgi:hypothetical protein